MTNETTTAAVRNILTALEVLAKTIHDRTGDPEVRSAARYLTEARRLLDGEEVARAAG